MNFRRSIAIGLAGLLLAPLMVAVAPAASAAECLSVSGGGLSYGTTYTLKVRNSCPETDYARYLFNDGTFGFTAEHSGFVSVYSGFDSTITVNLSSVAAGTHSPSIKFYEQGPYYGTPRFSLPSYTIQSISGNTPLKPYVPAAPAKPKYPDCSAVQNPAPAVGKQINSEEAQFTWKSVPGASSYSVKVGHWDGSQWVRGEWQSVGSVLSQNVRFNSETDMVTIWVSVDCYGTGSTVNSAIGVSRGEETLLLPNLDDANWVCVESDGDFVDCTQILVFSKRESKNVKGLVTRALADAEMDFSIAGVKPLAGVSVSTERKSRGVTIFLEAKFAATRMYI